MLFSSRKIIAHSHADGGGPTKGEAAEAGSREVLE